MFGTIQTKATPSVNAQPTKSLHLVSEAATRRSGSSSLADLALISARRGSSFCAEAAVLVLVFGILDIFLLKGHVEPAWVAGALLLSLGLLAASVAMDFSAHRWTKAHP